MPAKANRDGQREISGWINCKSFYFDDREAVTFNSDEFVGFAGWADDRNVQPILSGFCSWVDEMAHRVTR